MPELSLRYIIEIDDQLTPRELKERVFTGVETKMSHTRETSRKQNVRVIPIEGREFFLELIISFSATDLEQLGSSILLQIMLGNAFRSPHVRSLVLVDFYIDESSGFFPGPRYGSNVYSKLLDDAKGAICFPMSSGLSTEEWKSIVSDAITAGIEMFCDSPFSANSAATVAQRVEYLKSKSGEAKFLYFFAGNGPLTRLREIVDVISKTPDGSRYLGIRACPWSIGFEIVHLIREASVPLMLYSMFDLSMRSSGAKAISLPSSLVIQRFIGGDLIAIGLTTDEALADPSAEYAVRCTEPMTFRDGTALKPAIPLFAGDLTPRKAYNLVRSHGPGIALQAKKPLLRPISSSHSSEHSLAHALKFNVMAFKEAINLAASGGDADAEFESGGSRVQSWIKYERK